MTVSTKTKQILIVEDDQNSQSLIQHLLEHFTFQVSLASNGKQALEILKTQAFDAFIIDLSMPEMDGWQLLKAIQSNPNTAHLPCIAVTAYHSAEVAAHAKAAGFALYFSKPIDVYTFESYLSALLN